METKTNFTFDGVARITTEFVNEIKEKIDNNEAINTDDNNFLTPIWMIDLHDED